MGEEELWLGKVGGVGRGICNGEGKEGRWGGGGVWVDCREGGDDERMGGSRVGIYSLRIG